MNQFSPGSQGLLLPIQSICADKTVSEILVNQPGEIWVERGADFKRQTVKAFNEMHLYRLFQLIASENKQRISRRYPLLSGSLQDGSRVQLCLPPVSQFPVMSIRRKVVNNIILSDCESMHMFSDTKLVAGKLNGAKSRNQRLLKLAEENDWQQFMREAIAMRKNIVISGGTSSGKTTFLNACLQAVDLTDRLLILEDTREVQAPHKNQVSLLASKGDQGESTVVMQDLVQCSLRLRPDRIIMGEIRGAEIMDFVSACSTGHEGSLTTIHANNPELAFMRMTQMYKLNSVPSMTDDDIMRELKSVVDIVIQLTKTNKGRKIESVYLR